METPTPNAIGSKDGLTAPNLKEIGKQDLLYTLPDKGLTDRLQNVTEGYLSEVGKIAKVMNERYTALAYENIALKQRVEQLAKYEQANTALAKRLEELTLKQAQYVVADTDYKVKFYDEFLSGAGTFTSTQIAEQFGKSAVWLNQRLIEWGVLYRDGRYLHPTKAYVKKGITLGRLYLADVNDTVKHAKISLAWTTKGYELICKLLKQHGVKRNGSV